MIEVVLFDLRDTLIDQAKRWIPGARQTLTTLAGRGVRLGVVSNTGDLTREQLLALLPDDFSFDVFDPSLVVLSSEVGVEKPSLAIFRHAIDRAGVAAASILFCTETPLHVLAAQRAGLLALRLVEPPASDVGTVPDLLTDLEAIG